MNTTTTTPRTGQDAHTPTFWKTRDARSARGFLISGHDGMTVATAKTAHDAALIVRAVNSHAALVAALQEAQANLHSYQAYAEAMREHGRGHVPLTGKRGFGPEGLNSFIAAALDAARNP